MRRSKYKIIVMIFLVLILLLLVLVQFQFTHKALARVALSIYVNNHYSSMDLQYQKVEFVPQFVNFSIRYTDKNGKAINFMVGPKFIPVYILYDPLNPHP